MDCCFALMWAHQHGRAGCLSILAPRAATLLASTTVRDLWLVLEQYVCDSLTSGISTQPQKLDTVPVTNSYKTWQLLLRVILEQERIRCFTLSCLEPCGALDIAVLGTRMLPLSALTQSLT